MPPQVTPTVLQLVFIDETGDSYYRMRWPGAELVRQAAARKEEWRLVNLDARAVERLTWGRDADLLVLFQSNDLELLPILEHRRKQGKRTLVEYNDNFYEPPTASPVARDWSSPLVWQGYEMIMRAADAVMVTTPGLKQTFSSVVPKEKIHEITNHFPFELEPFEQLFQQPKGEIRLGWAGSVGHMPDFLTYLPALRALLAKHPQVKLCVMGNEALPSLLRLPQERFEFRKWGSMHEYLGFLKTLHVGLAPLLDTPYNRCRTDVKAIEMGARGVAPVLTRSPSYEHALEATKLESFTSPEEMTKILESMIADPSLIERSARAAYEYVHRERRANQRSERLELYRTLLQGARGAGSWSVGTGYHELKGTPESEPAALQTLKEADKLLKEKKGDEVAGVLDTYLQQNPNHPDILFNRSRIVGKDDGKELPVRLQKLSEQFPKDLRFRLLLLAATPDLNALAQGWQRLVTMLQGSSPRARQFWAKDIGRSFRKMFRAQPELVPVLDSLLKLFPEHLDLRMIAAELFELQGRFKEAHQQFRWISEQIRAFQMNREVLQQLDPNFYQTWLEVTEARSKVYPAPNSSPTGKG